jgi:hypothetical protein
MAVEEHNTNPANNWYDWIGEIGVNWFLKGMCLAEVEKPRDFTRLAQEYDGTRYWRYVCIS